MAAVGTILSVAQTLFAALESPVLKEIYSFLGYESELQNLKNTVSTVRAVFLDAEVKQELSNEALNWIEKLKTAGYDADDLLDQFTTLAEQKQLMERQGGGFSKELCLFFSCFNQLGVAYTMSREIKKIRKKLDAINCDHTQFGISAIGVNECIEPIRRRSRETCSYVYEQHVIGREDEKKAIINILLDPNVQGDVSFITIVGIGGLGKTTLAQLVYNDKKIEKEFPLRLWACVSDQDQKHFDMKAILCKILESATRNKHEGFELDVVQRKLREVLQGKKYLLFLDDVWNENRDECLKLGEFLMCGGRGNRVVVTTRSMRTARVMGNGCIFELQGLSAENSWFLFERMAFDHGQGEANPDLVEIGKDIVRKCANVPLAIRMVGSLLYGQSRRKWLSIQKMGLAKIGRGEDDIIHILKLSYYHLDSCCKSCFSYCAVFPKDYVMDKETLISLWMAQGFIKPLDEGQSIDDAGEEYFSILLRRCFFQNIQKDKYGEIISCKIHDLMHDIAQEVAGKEICVANSIPSKMDENLRHIFNVDGKCPQSFPQSKIRTYLRDTIFKSFPVGMLLSNWKYLRVLNLRYCGLRSLPNTIGRMLHLRYLDLSHNSDLKSLPKAITKLHNLQTLKLHGCSNLEKLPRDLSMLVKMRILDITSCTSLISMPPCMDKLTCLSKLPCFVVSKANSRWKQDVGKLEDIKALTNLKGCVEINIKGNVKYVKKYGESGFIRNKEHLNEISVMWTAWENGRRVDYEEALLEDLQPHPNLRGLVLKGYSGVVPSWAREDNLRNFLPNLVEIEFYGCDGWQCLPLLGRLQHLKFLRLFNLPNLEYIESTSTSSYRAPSGSRSRSRLTEFSFFPSLEKLDLFGLPKLKGWWREEAVGDDHIINSSSSDQALLLPFFPRISRLHIVYCPSLMFVPLCPMLEELLLQRFNERIQINMKGDQKEPVTTTSFSSYPLSTTGDSRYPKIRRVTTDNMGYLRSLPTEVFQCLSKITIRSDHELESLSEVSEVFQSCCFSLRHLEILWCSKLRTLSGALEHLTALESLHLQSLASVVILGEDNGMPWISLHQSLRYLVLCNLKDLVGLPKSMQHLTSLQTLKITHCENLEALPEWISCLSSLQVLDVHDCQGFKSLPNALQNLTSLRQFLLTPCPPALKLRCHNPNGEDWPKIQHIPDIILH